MRKLYLSTGRKVMVFASRPKRPRGRTGVFMSDEELRQVRSYTRGQGWVLGWAEILVHLAFKHGLAINHGLPPEGAYDCDMRTGEFIAR